MTIYKFFQEYILTRKAKLETQFRTSLDVSIHNDSVWIHHTLPRTGSPLKISYEEPVTCLTNYSIRILLVVDPVFLAASTLTGVISIPVPEPDELPF